MAATYSYTNLKDQIVDPISFANIGTALTILNIINRAARMVYQEVDLRSAKRKATLSPKLFDDQFDYTCPTDLKGEAVIDLIPQANRSLNSRFNLVTPEYFDRKKSTMKSLVAFSDDDLVRKVRVSADIDDTVATVASFNSLTGDGGTWALFGDGENVATNTENYLEGSGSIGFDISGAGGTTAGIQNTSVTTFDVTDYKDNGSAFIWVYINSTTNLTNFILRLGSDSSNYYSMTVTATNEGAAFQTGWNLLRFDLSGKSTTGTPDDDGCDYVAFYMTKAGAKVDDGYRVDNLTLHTGEYHDILYYSKYPWQTSAGAFIENSTTATDKINADTDELDLIVMKGKVEVFRELYDWEQMKAAQAEYEKMKRTYQLQNPSQRLMRAEWYN